MDVDVNLDIFKVALSGRYEKLSEKEEGVLEETISEKGILGLFEEMALSEGRLVVEPLPFWEWN